MKQHIAILVALMLATVSVTRAADKSTDSILTLSPNLQQQLTVKAVTRQPLVGEIDATAVVEADINAVAHITTRVPGRVVRVAVQLGERVKAGQTLVILSSEQLGGAKTEYLSSKSLLGIAKQHLDREETLYAQKISPQKDVLQARADYDTALAHYKTARERLRLLIPESDLAHVTWNENGTPLSEFALTTPLAGTVVKRDIAVGSMIDASDEPLTVINLDQVWVVANVFEHDLAELHQGADATITVGALPHRRFDGRVTYIADTVDPKTRTVQARVEVPNDDHLLKLGMFAHLRITSGENGREVLAVPTTALFDVGSKKVVFVAVGEGRYEPRSVEIGQRGDQTVEISAGLKPGEEIVISGGLLLKTLALNRGE